MNVDDCWLEFRKVLCDFCGYSLYLSEFTADNSPSSVRVAQMDDEFVIVF